MNIIFSIVMKLILALSYNLKTIFSQLIFASDLMYVYMYTAFVTLSVERLHELAERVPGNGKGKNEWK